MFPIDETLVYTEKKKFLKSDYQNFSKVKERKWKNKKLKKFHSIHPLDQQNISFSFQAEESYEIL